MSRQLATSRRIAQQEIRAGSVEVDGESVTKPSRLVGPEQELRLSPGTHRYVSRAGAKLAAALDAFSLEVRDRSCLDIGSSTGGFTDCLLQHGAARVVALDVGTDQLHPSLRANPHVVVLEQTDVRSLTSERLVELLGERPPVVTVDVSFISLSLVLPTIEPLVAELGTVVALVKPQFEAGRGAVARGRGIIRDPAIWSRVLARAVDAAAASNLSLQAAAVSPITGASGNVEFVVQLMAGGPSLDAGVRQGVLEDVVARAEARRA